MKNIWLDDVVISIMLFVMMMVLFMVPSKSLLYSEMNFYFECGFDPFESYGILFQDFLFNCCGFLMFDVVLVMIMPMMSIINMVNMIDLHIIMTMFLIILILLLYDEWYNKVLDWM